jgi:hypothetical protein
LDEVEDARATFHELGERIAIDEWRSQRHPRDTIKRLFGPSFEAVYDASLYEVKDQGKTEGSEDHIASNFITPTACKQLDSTRDDAEGLYLSNLAKLMHDNALNCGMHKRTRTEQDKIKRLVTELEHDAVKRALGDAIRMELNVRERP